MKRLLLSTAILGALAAPALAQDQFRAAADPMEIRASDFMGMRVYATETAVEGDEFQGIQEGWEDIGEVNDVILSRDGMVQAVLVDIGGFLGIGERRVAINMDQIRFVSDSATAEDADDFFLVVNATREMLEGAPEYSPGDDVAAAADATGEAIEGGAEATAAAAGAAAGAVAGAAAEAGTEVADEAADAGEEVVEEVEQIDMTDTQEDAAEAADTAQDASEEASEAATEGEMAADATAEAAVEGETVTTTTETVAEGTEAEAGAATEGEAVEVETVQVETTEGAATEGEMAAEGEADAAAADTATTEARTPIAREGFAVAGAEDLTSERLQGATAYDANDESVGNVSDLVLDESGQVTHVVIDVGGFLGIGAKPVALEMASVDILRAEGGDEIRVYLPQTREELDAMERYEPAQ